MKRSLFFFLLFLLCHFSKAQVTGSDTACAGYIYSYKATIPGAVSFAWTLPTGWYFLSGQGTDSIVANCNDTVGPVCVIGFDSAGVAIDTLCKNVTWGLGGFGWQVNASVNCQPPCYYQCEYLLYVSTIPPGCPGGCGYGTPNPNVTYGAFDNPWPTGNYLGLVNGQTPLVNTTVTIMTIYVYLVDTTFGTDSLLLVEGGSGCGPVYNTYNIPPGTMPWPVTVPLIQTPSPVCVGDTFTVSVDPFYSWGIAYYWWSTSANVTVLSQSSTFTAILNSPWGDVYFSGADANYCYPYEGFAPIQIGVCTPPTAGMSALVTSVCNNGCIQFTNQSAGAASYQWYFPGGTPAASNAPNPFVCYASPGQYNVALIASNSAGSDTLIMSNYVTVNAPPVISITRNNDSLSVPGGFVSYQWYRNGQPVGIGNSTCFAQLNGIYLVRVTDSNGCTASDSIVVNLPSKLAGSDTACAGYSYSYKAFVHGAVSYQWILPLGWYVAFGQGTDSVVVNCNDSAGQVCAVGFDTAGTPIDTSCKVVLQGTGGIGWMVSGTSTCLPPCYVTCTYQLNVMPILPGCPGACGDGNPNPNVVFAVFDNPWPGGTFRGLANGQSDFYDYNGYGTTLYVYEVDSTFGTDSLLLVRNYSGCGPVYNTYYIPPTYYPSPISVPLSQSPGTVCVGDTFTISANPAYGMINFSWSTQSPDIQFIGLTSDSSVRAVLLSVSYNVAVYFYGSAPGGCTGFSGMLQVNYSVCPPAPAAFTSVTSSGCEGTCMQFINQTAGGVSYQWIFQGGSPSYSTAYNPGVVCYSQPGQYDVTLVATDNHGSDTLRRSQYVSVYALPAVNAGPDREVCEGDSVVLSVPSGNACQWSTGSTMNSITVVPFASSSYTIQVSDSNGCRNEDSVAVVVHTRPVANAGNDVSVCIGSSVNLVASGGISSTWLSGNIVGNSIIVSPLASTDYSVEVTDAYGCKDTDSVSVQVMPLPVVSAGADRWVCPGTSVTLVATPGYTEQWSTGDTGNVLMISLLLPAEFTVQATDSHGCMNTDTVQIWIHSLMASPAGADHEICLGDSVTLSAAGGVAYSWTPSGSTQSALVVSPMQTMQWLVDVTDSNGCIIHDSVTVQVDPLPPVNAGSDQVICFGSSVTLMATGGITYTWNTGGAGNTIHIVPSVSSRYEVEAIDSNGCRAFDTVNIVVNPLPLANAGPDQAVCSGTSVTLTASGGAYYHWMPGGISSSVCTLTPVASTGYSVTVTDTNGCVNSDTVIVTVNPLPAAFAGTNQDICAGSHAVLQASGGVGYSWSGSNETSNGIVVSPDSSEDFIVRVWDVNGCINRDTVHVAVHPLPTARFGLSGLRCENRSILISNMSTIASGSLSSSRWDLGDGTLATTTNIAHVYSQTGWYAVMLTATSDAGCIDSTTATVFVNATPRPDFLVLPVCLDQPAQFMDSSTLSGGSIIHWNWDFGDGSGSGVQQPHHRYSSPGLYDISLEVTSDSGCMGNLTMQQVLEIYPLPEVQFQPDPPQAPVNYARIQFASQVNGATTLNWNFGDGSYASSEFNPMHVYTSPGQYQVSLYAISMEGCENRVVHTVDINADVPVYFPNSFSPNSDGLNDIFIPSGTGITGVEMRIYDRWGMEIYTSNASWDGTAHGKACVPGTYVYFAKIADYRGLWYQFTGQVTLIR